LPHLLLAVVQARLQPFDLPSLRVEGVVEGGDLRREVGVDVGDAGGEVGVERAGGLGEVEEAVDGGDDGGDAFEERVVGVVEAAGGRGGEGVERGEGAEELPVGGLAR
ncbi:MAG: hypothetical protein LQ347_006652, partial [Umbilicaria vellea]